MFTRKTAEETYLEAVAADRARHKGMRDAAERDHTASMAKADATRAMAVSVADDKLRTTTASLDAGLRAKLDEALTKFDAAARQEFRVPDSIQLQQRGPSRVEVRHIAAVEPIATAIDEGAGRWVVVGGGERRFFGSATAARRALWELAAQHVGPPLHAA